jgi:histidinol-phosphatase (PHP family)
MARKELPEYIRDIDKARKDYPSLRLMTGMECDFKPEYTNYFKDYLLGEMGLEYLTGSVHFIYDYNGPGMDVTMHGDSMDGKQWKTYTDYYVKAIESGCFTFMNHPDLFGQMICKWDSESEAASKYIIEATKANNMPLELNTSGLVKKQVRIQESHRMQYPVIPFWEMVADAGLDVVVNTDAHNPKRLDTNMLWAENLVERLGLKRIYF